MEVTWFPVSCEDLLFSSVQICFTAAAQNASVPPAGLEGVLAFTPTSAAEEQAVLVISSIKICAESELFNT